VPAVESMSPKTPLFQEPTPPNHSTFTGRSAHEESGVSGAPPCTPRFFITRSFIFIFSPLGDTHCMNGMRCLSLLSLLFLSPFLSSSPPIGRWIIHGVTPRLASPPPLYSVRIQSRVLLFTSPQGPRLTEKI